MEVSRITFSKETQEKIKRGMSAHKKGEILYGRLTEASENGLLAQCKTRKEVAELVGYYGANLQHRGYSWINNLIRRKHLSEVAVAPGEYQYFLGPNKPDYNYAGLSKAKSKKAVVAKTPVTTAAQLENVYNTTETSTTILSAKIVVKKGDKTIEIEGDRELAKDVIKMFMED